jgi:flagellar hook protein FlgE
MMRSLFSAISGLKAHQTMMDVVGNNISNVNTSAFKSSRITFQDIISQTLRGAQAPTGAQGGMNPMQIGLGVQTGSVDSLMTQGNLQSTNKPTDIAIQGDGFFQVTDGANQYYTRDGNFTIDSGGKLIHAATGMAVVPAITIPAGATNFTITQNGQVSWTVGSAVTTGPILTLNNFANPAGLTRAGNNLFTASNNSGAATPGNPGAAGLGTVQAGFLEMSNVDLAAQFTNMIIAQRGFQANSRVITASDEILQDLVNIKR